MSERPQPTGRAPPRRGGTPSPCAWKCGRVCDSRGRTCDRQRRSGEAARPPGEGGRDTAPKTERQSVLPKGTGGKGSLKSVRPRHHWSPTLTHQKEAFSGTPSRVPSPSLPQPSLETKEFGGSGCAAAPPQPSGPEAPSPLAVAWRMPASCSERGDVRRTPGSPDPGAAKPPGGSATSPPSWRGHSARRGIPSEARPGPGDRWRHLPASPARERPPRPPEVIRAAIKMDFCRVWTARPDASPPSGTGLRAGHPHASVGSPWRPGSQASPGEERCSPGGHPCGAPAATGATPPAPPARGGLSRRADPVPSHARDNSVPGGVRTPLPLCLSLLVFNGPRTKAWRAASSGERCRQEPCGHEEAVLGRGAGGKGVLLPRWRVQVGPEPRPGRGQPGEPRAARRGPGPAGDAGEGGREPGAPPSGSGAKGQAEDSARGVGAAARVTAARPSHPQLGRGGPADSGRPPLFAFLGRAAGLGLKEIASIWSVVYFSEPARADRRPQRAAAGPAEPSLGRGQGWGRPGGGNAPSAAPPPAAGLGGGSRWGPEGLSSSQENRLSPVAVAFVLAVREAGRRRGSVLRLGAGRPGIFSSASSFFFF